MPRPVTITVEDESIKVKTTIVWTEDLGCYVGQLDGAGTKRAGGSVGEVLDMLLHEALENATFRLSRA